MAVSSCRSALLRYSMTLAFALHVRAPLSPDGRPNAVGRLQQF